MRTPLALLVLLTIVGWHAACGTPLPSSIGLINLLSKAANSYQYNFAMQQAVTDVNAARILPVNLTFTWLSPSSDPVQLQKAIIPYMTTAKRTSGNYAIMFGDKSSTNTEPNAWYAAAYSLTTMLTSATASAFSDKSHFPTVFRTVGADMSTAHGFVALMSLAGWTRIAVIVSVDELGLSFLSYFLTVVPPGTDYTVLTLPASNNAKYLQSLLNVLRTGQYRVILVMATPGNAGYILDQAMSSGMLAPNSSYTWFVGSSYCASSTLGSMTSTELYQLSALICIIDGYDTPDNLYNFRARMTNLTTAAKLTTSNGLITFDTDFNYAIPAGYDAVWMIASALQAINSTSYSGPPVTWSSISDVLASQLPYVNITGCSGKQLYFDADHESPYSVDFLQLNLTCAINATTGQCRRNAAGQTVWAAGDNGFNYLGSWTAQSNTLTLKSPIVWPDGEPTPVGVINRAGLLQSASLDYFPTYPASEPVSVQAFGDDPSAGSGLAVAAAVLCAIFAHKAMITLSATLALLVGLERSSAKKTARLQEKQRNKLAMQERQQRHAAQVEGQSQSDKTITSTSASGVPGAGMTPSQQRRHALQTEWRLFLEMSQDPKNRHLDRHVAAWFVLTAISMSLLVVIAPYLLLFLARTTDLSDLPIVFTASTLAAAMVTSFGCGTLAVLCNVCHYLRKHTAQLKSPSESGVLATQPQAQNHTQPAKAATPKTQWQRLLRLQQRLVQWMRLSIETTVSDLKQTTRSVASNSVWLWLSVFWLEATIIVPFHLLQQSWTTSAVMSVSSSVGCFLVTPAALILPCLHICTQLVPATVCRTGQGVRRTLLAVILAGCMLLVYGIDSSWYSFAFDQALYNDLTDIVLSSAYLTTSQVWIIPAALCGYGLFMLMGLLIHRHQLSKSVMDVVLASQHRELQKVSDQLENAQQERSKWQNIVYKHQAVLTLLNNCRPGVRVFAMAAYATLQNAQGADESQLRATMAELNEILQSEEQPAPFSPAMLKTSASLSFSQVLNNVVYMEWWKDQLSGAPTISVLGSGLSLLALYADLFRLRSITNKSVKGDLAQLVYNTYMQANSPLHLAGLATLVDNSSSAALVRSLPTAQAEVTQRLQQYFEQDFIYSPQYRLCAWMHEQGTGGRAMPVSPVMINRTGND